ncbi:MAG: flagellar basal body rod protein FlgB [Fusobacteriota bacterium]
MKLFNNNITALEKSLDAYSKRSDLLANNIANVNTPNYKRQDIQFENILSDAISSDEGATISGNVTQKGHISINPETNLENVKPKLITEQNTKMRNDKNNVDIEKEQAEFAKNNIRYKFATGRLTQEFRILNTVIKTK